LWVLAGFLALAGPLSIGLGVRGSRVEAAGCWQATVTEQRTDVELIGSVLRVSVEGMSGLPVTIRSRGAFHTLGFTSTKPEYGPWVAEFAPLSKGTYYIEPDGLGISYEIWLDGKNYTRVDFSPTACAPPPTYPPALPTATSPVQLWAPAQPATATALPPAPAPTQQPQPSPGWSGGIAQHSRNPGGGVMWATIAVRVIGRPAGQEVEIHSGGWSAVEKTGTKPEHGPDACEFGALQAGTYRLNPVGLDAPLSVTVEPGDFMLLEFYQVQGTVTHWASSVVENTGGDQPTEHVNSAIVVVVAGKPWHEVEIRSDGWSTTAKTGYKPEYGPDACEFGGLRAGTYTIIPKGLGTSAQVTMDGWGWAQIRFEQVSAPGPAALPSQPLPTPVPASASATAVSQPSPTAARPSWQGRVVSNTSGQRLGSGVSSVIVVRVLGWVGVPVTITGGGGWTTTCITGTKPEYGWDACEFGGLWPASYRLLPEGAAGEVEVTVDGLGMAIVEFAAP
jgi:hypothetical protein